MTDTCDLAVIGAGPAGLAAATQAAELGLGVVLIDEQPQLGGQVYRAGAVLGTRTASILGADYGRGAALTAAFHASGAGHLADTSVVAATPERELLVLRAGRIERLRPRRLLLATGAIERPWPIPGWTLPGVMAAGAAQIALKTSGLVPEGPVVLAGSGPLLYLVALQLRRAGCLVRAVLDTTPYRNRFAALGLLPLAIAEGRHLWRGLKWVTALQALGVPVKYGVSRVTAEGADKLYAVSWRRHGMTRRVKAVHLLLHQGVIPNTQLSRALGLAHDYDAIQATWAPRTDSFGASSDPWVTVAGDGAGIRGALDAESTGRLAALDTALRLGRLDAVARDARAAAHRAALRRRAGARAFLDVLFRPAASVLVPPQDDVMVCRCEEVTAGEVRAAVAAGALGPNQLKAYTRCGMGPCQGRVCGPVVAAIVAAERQVDVQAVGLARVRWPLRPVPLAALAELARTDEN